MCFIAAISDEQVREFGGIITDLKVLFERSKGLPESVEKLQTEVTQTRRLLLSRNGAGRGEIRPGQVVSDDCAEYLAAIAITLGEKDGKFDILGASSRDALLSRSRSILGVSQQSALTSSDIPLPVEYSGQVVALVNL